jgi:hypothetical protein
VKDTVGDTQKESTCHLLRVALQPLEARHEVCVLEGCQAVTARPSSRAVAAAQRLVAGASHVARGLAVATIMRLAFTQHRRVLHQRFTFVRFSPAFGKHTVGAKALQTDMGPKASGCGSVISHPSGVSHQSETNASQRLIRLVPLRLHCARRVHCDRRLVSTGGSCCGVMAVTERCVPRLRRPRHARSRCSGHVRFGRYRFKFQSNLVWDSIKPISNFCFQFQSKSQSNLKINNKGTLVQWTCLLPYRAPVF